MGDPAWRLAACRDRDPELFFPVGHGGPAHLQEEQAKAVCALCEIRELCFDNALEYGVWGGYTESERRSMRRRGVKTI